MDNAGRIKQTVSIFDVARYYGLKTNACNKVLSIYKREKTHSLMLYAKDNTFHYFCTENHGDQIQFDMDFYKVGFKDAVQGICSIWNISYEGPPESRGRREQPKQPTEPPQQPRETTLIEGELSFYEERAAIYEFEARLIRPEAEQLALKDITGRRSRLQEDIYSAQMNHCNGCSPEHLDYLTGDDRKLTLKKIERFWLFSLGADAKIFLRDAFSLEDLQISCLFTETGYFLFANHGLIIPYLVRGDCVDYLRGRYFMRGKARDCFPVIHSPAVFKREVIADISPFQTCLWTHFFISGRKKVFMMHAKKERVSYLPHKTQRLNADYILLLH